jgi:hypothetical protein
MRDKVALSLLGGLVLSLAPVATTAWANSWHTPEVYEESNGGYTNYTYDDGLCRYHYWSSSFEHRADASRNGDCSHLVIGPDGRVMSGADMEDEQ